MYYESYFKLKEPPFSISPDPRYLYLTQSHREALAHLLYGVSSNGGFVLLTGEIGAGKTTVCRCLLGQLPEHTDVAYVLNSKLSTLEFMAAICDELGVQYDENASLKKLVDHIYHHLLKSHGAGRNTVLMVDEAQNLDLSLIEQLRLLTNLETNQKKLLQIILVGQPELREKLALPGMRQMAQRITARFHLGPLRKKDIRDYVHHRLKVAGGKNELFSRECYSKLWQYTKGVPRLINVICDRALLGVFVGQGNLATGNTIERAASEVLGTKAVKPNHIARWGWSIAALLLVAGAFAASYYYRANHFESQTFTERYFGDESISEQESPVDVVDQVNEDQPEKSESGFEQDLSPALEEESMETDDALSASESPPKQIQTTNILAPQIPTAPGVTEQAHQTILNLWELPQMPATAAGLCDFVESQGVSCLYQQGNTETLKQINRPALLTLFTEDGSSYLGALAGMTDSTATVVINGQPQTVTWQELRRWWYGDFLVLWRLPPGYRFPLREGAAGESVGWLSNALGDEAPALRYDESMVDRVKIFQRDHGLIPDGVVGPLTIIALNNQHTENSPQLFDKEQH
ncbi:AAA family ATPase [Porticoccaceae bacterium LTM1]|nr:AAA family ATPase [Porticoccaceae bacterium LTM1]